MRTPLSKQRNKHIQQVLVEAARLAPRYSDELALLHERERQEGTATGPRSPWPGRWSRYMLAVERTQQDFVPAGSSDEPRQRKNLPKKEEKHQDHIDAQAARSRS